MPLEFEHLIEDIPEDWTAQPYPLRIITTRPAHKAKFSINTSIFTGQHLETATALAKARNESHIKGAIFSDLRGKVTELLEDYVRLPMNPAGNHQEHDFREKLIALLNSIP